MDTERTLVKRERLLEWKAAVAEQYNALRRLILRTRHLEQMVEALRHVNIETRIDLARRIGAHASWIKWGQDAADILLTSLNII
jgi:hypothetical protein